MGGQVEFLLVYIAEAHSRDEWPIGNETAIDQPKTEAERLQAARKLAGLGMLGMPMAVDTIINEYERAYSAWPTRYCLMTRISLHLGWIRNPTERPVARGVWGAGSTWCRTAS
jgi:hypothetical protein